MLDHISPVVPPSGQGDPPGGPPKLVTQIDYECAHVLRRADVLERLAISEAQLYWLIAQGYYPEPFPLGPKLRGWLQSSNDAWITLRMLARDQQSGPEDPAPFELWTPEMDLIVPPHVGLQLMRFDEVLSRVRIGSTALWEKVLNHTFPAPIAIGTRGKRWVLYEVGNWIRAQHERRRDEDPAYRFLTQRLDAIRPTKDSSDPKSGTGGRPVSNSKRSKTRQKD